MANVPITLKIRNESNGWDTVYPKTTLAQIIGLISGDKIDPALIPQQAITDVEVVSSESAMLALSDFHRGDVAVRSDINATFILQDTPASTLGNWVQLPIPQDLVLSVNTKTGAITLTGADIVITGYTKASSETAVAATDTINEAVGKLEYALGQRAPANVALTEAAGSSTLPGTASTAVSVTLQTIRNNLKWLFENVGGLDGRANVTAGATEPLSPAVGDIWFDYNNS
ncbi:MAG: hypothetical protein LBL83_03800 [Clostridiales bacterium]|jgi:hypothetical protein|nr:hypothetical protein [Clostridiales bacterium]